MPVYDVCNGDADGLCAALQWRLARPSPATLVTGLKREIALLGRVPAMAGDEVNVFDLALPPNQEALGQLLGRGVRVRYFDHHAGDAGSHPLLEARIDTRGDTCASLLVDGCVGARYRAWALVGAFGDNLAAVAGELAASSGFGPQKVAGLRRLGEAINYNAYGDSEADVLIAPAKLYAIMARHVDPQEMLHEPVTRQMLDLRGADLARAWSESRYWRRGTATIHVLPDAAWARRVLGTYANELAAAEPAAIHAVFREQAGNGYLVSIRAPAGAHELCRRFGGGGRARAAGIDHLPGWRFCEFVDACGMPAGVGAGAAPE